MPSKAATALLGRPLPPLPLIQPPRTQDAPTTTTATGGIAGDKVGFGAVAAPEPSLASEILPVAWLVGQSRGVPFNDRGASAPEPAATVAAPEPAATVAAPEPTVTMAVAALSWRLPVPPEADRMRPPLPLPPPPPPPPPPPQAFCRGAAAAAWNGSCLGCCGGRGWGGGCSAGGWGCIVGGWGGSVCT